MFWILAISYWIHLLCTVVWLGSLTVMGLAAFPALRQGTLVDNQWVALQKRLVRWNNGALILLLITGFYQMTNDPNYGGFLVFDGVWAWAMLLKHIAFVGMVGLTIFAQAVIYPQFERVQLLAEKRPSAAKQEQANLQQQDIRLLRLNLICAVLVLFFTAVATAV